MTDQHQKKQDDSGSGVSPVVAAVTGAVVGASVAVAGAVILSDEKNREKVKEVLGEVKEKAVGYVEAMHEKTDEKIAQGKDKVDAVVNAAKDS